MSPPPGWPGSRSHQVTRWRRRGAVDRRCRRLLAIDLELAAVDEPVVDHDAEALLARLPAAQGDAVRARVLDDEPYAVIAARMDVTEPVVRQWVSRGLRGLRAHLRPPGDGDAS